MLIEANNEAVRGLGRFALGVESSSGSTSVTYGP